MITPDPVETALANYDPPLGQAAAESRIWCAEQAVRWLKKIGAAGLPQAIETLRLTPPGAEKEALKREIRRVRGAGDI